MAQWIKYELWQGGICVAAVSGSEDQDIRLQQEISHYAMQYRQDGYRTIKGPMPDDELDDEAI